MVSRSRSTDIWTKLEGGESLYPMRREKSKGQQKRQDAPAFILKLICRLLGSSGSSRRLLSFLGFFSFFSFRSSSHCRSRSGSSRSRSVAGSESGNSEQASNQSSDQVFHFVILQLINMLI